MKYLLIDELEARAKREADGKTSVRLPRSDKQFKKFTSKAWLTVEWDGSTFRYGFERGRNVTHLSRVTAQAYINGEHE